MKRHKKDSPWFSVRYLYFYRKTRPVWMIWANMRVVEAIGIYYQPELKGKHYN